MKIAVLGTGMVGQAIASKLVELGHEVMMGSRNADNPKALAWRDEVSDTGSAAVGTFAEATEFADVLFNCTQGMISLEMLQAIGAQQLGDKILVDVANPLDFSNGMPATLSVCNDDSLGEQIQRNFPALRVVKTLNTVNCDVMVNPALAGSDHDLFISGNDNAAKTEVCKLLESFGWKTIHDLGDISTARGTEQMMPIWLRLWGKIGHANFGYKIVVNTAKAQ